MLSDRAMRQLRRASVAARRLPGAVLLLDVVRRAFGRRKRTVTVGDFDGALRMRLCLHEHMQSQTFWFGYYSRDIILLFDRLLHPGMVVFDIGANVGEIALAAARRVGPHGRVYAFEPVPHLYQSLEEHVAINRLRQVVPVAQGLLNEETECTIFEAPARLGDGMVNTGLATIYGDKIRSRALGRVPMTTLDSYCRRMRISRIDVVKIDVEGAELAV
ncbi:MAG TPA: FkbM family methyltransferase, partial [Gemmatimonadaceae bacterium]